MIAISIPARRILFRYDMTDEEKVDVLWDVWWGNAMFLPYKCPLMSDQQHIPDVVEFIYDKKY